MDHFTYLIPSAFSHGKLQKNLPKSPNYKISLQKGEKTGGVLLDTFNFKMFQSAQMLFQAGKMLILMDLRTGRQTEQAAVENWNFAGDLPDGPIASFLGKASSLRAFLPVTKVELRFDHGLLLDNEKKTRARFHILFICHGRKSVGIGTAEYLRGYDPAYADLCLGLENTGAKKCQDISQVYESLDITRGKNKDAQNVQLNSEAPAKESARIIIKAFLETARLNEDGIVADYDTEFLHDYRVSLRKVRSVLSLFKGVISPEDTASLKQDFAFLMQETNNLRDLDVYLLKKEEYFNMIPKDTHEGLNILFKYFAVEREKEQKRVSKVLRSKIYLTEIGRLKNLFTDALVLTAGPRAEENSLDFACRLILKRYNKVCKIARSIDEKTEDGTIHQLRINCKKLRYLMEFFGPLFPEKEIKTLIKSLKLLQDNLGNFNDYVVQQTFLRQVLSQKMSYFAGRELKVAESIGALTAMLCRLKEKERLRVMKNLNLFDSQEISSIFTKLFHTEEDVNESNSLLQ